MEDDEEERRRSVCTIVCLKSSFSVACIEFLPGIFVPAIFEVSPPDHDVRRSAATQRATQRCNHAPILNGHLPHMYEFNFYAFHAPYAFDKKIIRCNKSM